MMMYSLLGSVICYHQYTQSTAKMYRILVFYSPRHDIFFNSKKLNEC